MITCKRSEEIIAQFKNKKVLVIGDLVLDHYVIGSVDRLNPEAPVSLLDVKQEKNTSGGAGNVAKNTAMLGATATLLAMIGQDQAAEQLKDASKSEGFELVALTEKNRPTSQKTRFLAGSQQLLRVDKEVKYDIDSVREEELKQLISDHAGKYDAILVSDYAKGLVTENIAQHILKTAQKHNIPVAVDAKPSRIHYFKGATFMSPNRKEAREALGLTDEEHVDPTDLATRFAENFETTACVTLSADGIVVVGPDQEVLHVPQMHVREVYDVSGAGDTAIVTMLFSRLSEASWEEALQLANAAAAVVIAKIGTVGLTADELHTMICHDHE